MWDLCPALVFRSSASRWFVSIRTKPRSPNYARTSCRFTSRDLDDLVAKNVKEGRLSFTTNLAEGTKGADAIFIAVGTPGRRGDGHADLSHVHAAAGEIAEAMEGYTVVVTKSTVPVGTGREVEKIIRETNPRADFDVVSNPEFLREDPPSTTSCDRIAW